ncbi:hypothetical protein BGZ76_006998 [Entomortierella beljakovae]|nr:hypothetical protein BGZ76_006998 [Entomortierella beljakovae]
MVLWLISTFDSTTATIVVLVITLFASGDKILHRNAAFGPQIPSDGITLSLIPIETYDKNQETTACQPVTGAPINGSWVALVERGGDCSFVVKVRNMQASGAKAVIVGDNQNSGLVTMYARDDTSDVLIPSVFITQRHYRELRYLGIDYGGEFLVNMTPDDMNWPLLDVCPICKRDICVVTESTPLLGLSSSRNNLRDGNNDVRRASFRSSPSTNIPSSAAPFASSSSSGASSSSSAPASTNSAPTIASSWPLSLQRQSARVAAAARGLGSRASRGITNPTTTQGIQESQETVNTLQSNNLPTEEEVHRRV